MTLHMRLRLERILCWLGFHQSPNPLHWTFEYVSVCPRCGRVKETPVC